MNTNLTLRLDDQLIAGAKRHSAECDGSISQSVAGFGLDESDYRPLGGVLGS
ncbi:MAG: DUF6364 family protein [Actinomycetes bacterium]